MTVEFRLLGEVEARVGDRLIDVGHARQRCVLAVLLVDANRAVPIDQLVDRSWGERAPQRARGALYTYLTRLRKALAGANDASISRRPAGYVLTVDPMAVDLHRFHRLLEQARATDDDEAAAALLGQALGLWRGEACATLDTPWFNSVRGQLDQERLGAELDRNDVELRLGHHGALLAALSARADARPLDERLAGQLLLALYRSGRPRRA